mmetsp:Transcript_30320/g.87442  ORF Transcript_30320/g.87442 Transcript_30320/m.87442 type:complete len:220 (+) Transcript_30320:1339-1998(+)
MDRPIGQPCGAEAPRHLEAQDAAHGAVHVLNRDVLDGHALLRLERMRSAEHELAVEDVRELVVLGRATKHGAVAPRGHGLQGPCRLEEVGEVEVRRLPVLLQVRLWAEKISAPHQLIEGAAPELRHVLAHVLGDQEEEVDEVLRLAGELLPQLRVLRRDTNGASVQVALAHHDAAKRDEGGGRERHLLSAQQRRHDDIAARPNLAIRLDRDSVAQAVEY